MLKFVTPQTAGRIVVGQAPRLPRHSRILMFFTGVRNARERRLSMKNYLKVLFSILAAAICTVGFAADKPSCQKTGKNCPMNDNKACNCGKSCDCG
jgi:hypothetical protein